MQQVHDAGDLLVAVQHGNDDGGHGGAELGLQGVEAGVVVAVVLIGAGDEDHAGLGAQHLPGALGADAEAVLGAADQQGALGGTDAGECLTRKVKVARSVQKIDLHVLVLDGSHGEGDGYAALDLLGVVVADGVAVGDTAHAVDGAGGEEHALSQSGLAAAAVAQQADVADGLGGIAHCRYTPYVDAVDWGRRDARRGPVNGCDCLTYKLYNFPAGNTTKILAKPTFLAVRQKKPSKLW